MAPSVTLRLATVVTRATPLQALRQSTTVANPRLAAFAVVPVSGAVVAGSGAGAVRGGAGATRTIPRGPVACDPVQSTYQSDFPSGPRERRTGMPSGSNARWARVCGSVRTG